MVEGLGFGKTSRIRRTYISGTRLLQPNSEVATIASVSMPHEDT